MAKKVVKETVRTMAAVCQRDVRGRGNTAEEAIFLMELVMVCLPGSA
jgi:hypothetical protein